MSDRVTIFAVGRQKGTNRLAAAMLYEVENKFPVEDLESMARRLVAHGARFDEAIEQVDHYFAHPARDFAQTDEALRIRRVGECNLVTYKGPKIDQATKTRYELELPLATGGELARQYVQLLRALGFRSVAEVRKRRRCGRFTWRQWPVEATLDEVEGVGRFVELEIRTDADTLREAQTSLIALAAELGLTNVERRSYLEMLLASR
jgi:adenylate cyclase class 2